ncbi:hypothetical protein JL721_4604 [Aureococcus anophagefferens]|nr:hypothetical protein JL721_4604 [Aureococcus anophagefferens]
MSGWFTVTGKNGALVRAEARMDSAKVEELAKGTLVRIEETATLPEGKERGRLTHPLAGWITKHETDKASTGKERDDKLRALHEKTGAELLELFEKNGGFQIKFGQILASQTKMLPKEITDALRPLQDGAPERPWAAVDAVLTRPTAASPAAARRPACRRSGRRARPVAQVHGAVLTPEAAAKFGAPANIVLKAFITESIEQELDFTNEAAQCEKLGGFLARARPGAGVAVKRSGFMLGDLPSVRAPRVIRGLSNTGLLAMERVEGCRPTDGAAVRDMGATPGGGPGPARGLRECIFLHGYVHGDLHPGI